MLAVFVESVVGGWKDGWVDGREEGRSWMDGRKDGWMDERGTWTQLSPDILRTCDWIVALRSVLNSCSELAPG